MSEVMKILVIMVIFEIIIAVVLGYIADRLGEIIGIIKQKSGGPR